MRFPVLPPCAAAVLLCVASLPAQSPTLLRLSNVSSVDRLVVDSAGGMVVSGSLYGGTIPITGPGARLMWYPAKNAFRAGFVDGTQWDEATVGIRSTATGWNTSAGGLVSTAMGVATIASGTGSTAMGAETKASEWASTAMGEKTTASGSWSTAMGLQTTASGVASIATGSETRASGHSSTAMGSNTTASGSNSTALGSNASTNGRSGAFVYGDISTSATNALLNATADNQFSVRAVGGLRFFTNAELTAGVTLAAGGGTWNAVSDRARKEHFLSVDGEDLLARIRTLPISTWRYIAEEDRSVRHIGPMAQDWYAAFGLSSDSLTINSGDFDGVNLAAVQALEARTAALREENAALRAEIVSLRARVQASERMEERLRRLEEADARPAADGVPQ
jgi:trimeric autotransporter adhesin